MSERTTFEYHENIFNSSENTVTPQCIKRDFYNDKIHFGSTAKVNYSLSLYCCENIFIKRTCAMREKKINVAMTSVKYATRTEL